MKHLIFILFVLLISCSKSQETKVVTLSSSLCNKSGYLTKDELGNKAKYIAWSGGSHYLVDSHECTPFGFCDYVGNYPIPKGTQVEITDECVVYEGGIKKQANRGDCIHASVSFPVAEIVSMSKAKKKYSNMYDSKEAYSELKTGGYNGFTPSYSFLMDRCGNFLGD